MIFILTIEIFLSCKQNTPFEFILNQIIYLNEWQLCSENVILEPYY